MKPKLFDDSLKCVNKQLTQFGEFNFVVKIVVTTNKIDLNNPINNNNFDKTSGTGFFFTNDDITLILTCYHVVEDAINIRVHFNQQYNINASIVHVSPEDDIAVIKITEVIDNLNIPELDFKLKKNMESVITYGYPINSSNLKITKGIISGFQNSFIQIDAAINPGNSGGPLLLGNKIIGINAEKVVKDDTENTGFAIPMYRFYLWFNKINDKIIIKPNFNFEYQEQYKDNIRITNIHKLSYLNKYLQVGDIILSINDNKIDEYGYIKFFFFPDNIHLDELYLWFAVNDTLKLVILRDNKEITKNIRLEYNYDNLINNYNYLDDKIIHYNKSGIVFSIITKKHLDELDKLDISTIQRIKIVNRYLLNKDLFSVYISHINYNEIANKTIRYPKGNIIMKINNKEFNNYKEFTKIIKNPIINFTTIENNEYFL
jgi:hypothetical protein